MISLRKPDGSRASLPLLASPLGAVASGEADMMGEEA